MSNVAYGKESFVSSKQRTSPQKRHSSSSSGSGSSRSSSALTSRGAGWVRGHASRAVDGLIDQGTGTGDVGGPSQSGASCTILDNFYVDQPVWMVDLKQTTSVSGVIIVTRHQHGGTSSCDVIHTDCLSTS